MSLAVEYAQSDLYQVHTFVLQMATACCDEYLRLGWRLLQGDNITTIDMHFDAHICHQKSPHK